MVAAALRWRPEHPGNILSVTAGLLVAVALGCLAVLSPPLALVAVGAVAFVIAAVRDLTVGVAIFTLLTFFENIPGTPATGLTAVKGVGAVLALSWLLLITDRRGAAPFLLRDRPWLAYVAVFLVGWAAVSMLWATDPGRTFSDSFRLLQNVLLFFIVFSCIRSRRDVRLILWAYIAGAFLTALVGLGGATKPESIGPYGGTDRLAGGIGDPNELAALVAPALVLAAFSLATVRSPLGRLALLTGGSTIGLALLFTQSRGGIVALAAILVTGALLAGPLRARLIAVGLTTIALGISYFTFTGVPEQFQRLTAFSAGGGTGRLDLWRVTIEMIRDHPLLGVGHGNFQVVEPLYATRNINITFIEFVVDTPKVAHNTYLELLTELGPIGLGAFLVLLVGASLTALRAAKVFSQLGDRVLEIESRALVIGFLGTLAAFMFITAQYEKQLWLLLGLAVGLGTLANRGRDQAAAR
jgi:O-antigen ligase